MAARRTKGMGSITRRGDKFQVYLDLGFDDDGKRTRVYETAPDRKAAEAALARLKIQHAARDGSSAAAGA